MTADRPQKLFDFCNRHAIIKKQIRSAQSFDSRIGKDGSHLKPDIRQFNFYSNHNTFSGSYGRKNFLIVPKDNLEVSIWDQPVCSGLAEFTVKKEFPLTPEGFDEMSRWLGEELERGK